MTDTDPRPLIDTFVELPHEDGPDYSTTWHLYVVVDHDADMDWFYVRELINGDMGNLGEIVEVHTPGTYGAWRKA